jgi:NAD(P)-dependent dehydrogenase (short-subunit alcohol dehydrogenase family)
MTPAYDHALIIGAGPGLSASLARLFHARGLKVSLASRDPDDLGELARETGATAHRCDAGDHAQVAAFFAALDAAPPDVLVYNPSARVRGPLIGLDPAAVENAVRVTALGAFYAAQQAAKRMIPASHGAILLTGASAGVKGYARSASFAMGKFALRGLAQSMARELHPLGIHVGHFVIDGAIGNPGRSEGRDRPDSMLDPDAIARSYWHFLEQDRSAWAWEIELRPWVETF